MSTSSMHSGAGNAASERLYQQAGSMRKTRDKLRLEKQAAAARPSPRSFQSKRSAALSANRFAHVMAAATPIASSGSSGAPSGGGAEEGGSGASSQCHDRLNYGDLLYMEGQMQRERQEQLRLEELERREREDDACTFRPKLSAIAASLPERPLIHERADAIQSHREERLRQLEHAVRSETDKELTFRPTCNNPKTAAITSNYGDFLEEMRSRDSDREERMVALKLRSLEQEAQEYTFQPETLNSQRSPPWGVAPDHGEETREGVKPVHERLYERHTAAYGSSRMDAPPLPRYDERECTFHPNLSAASARDGSACDSAGGSAAAALPLTRTRLEQRGQALYEDAQDRRLRQQMLREQLHARMEALRNARKVSANSDRLAFQRLQREVGLISFAHPPISPICRTPLFPRSHI